MTPRPALLGARRVVVKIGSSSLTGAGGGLDVSAVDELARSLSVWAAADPDRRPVLVSSGAIAAGLGPLGFARRPRDLPSLQAAASVGQGLLVQRYADAFAESGHSVGQVLLTAQDMIRRAHYRNARQTLERLLDLAVIPVINENDAVATAEIRLGDNDRLAALVAHLVRADVLLLLSDVAGLYDADPRADPAATVVGEVRSASDLVGLRVGGSGSTVGSGGMATKVDAAQRAAAAGVAVVVAAAADLPAALAGEPVGTLFHPTGPRPTSRLAWLAHATEPAGRLVLDPGAVRAVVERRVSLLAAGVTGAVGDFAAGDPVDLVGADGVVVARGLVAYDADELPPMFGRSSRDLGTDQQREVVHRDDLVLL